MRKIIIISIFSLIFLSSIVNADNIELLKFPDGFNPIVAERIINLSKQIDDLKTERAQIKIDFENSQIINQNDEVQSIINEITESRGFEIVDKTNTLPITKEEMEIKRELLSKKINYLNELTDILFANEIMTIKRKKIDSVFNVAEKRLYLLDISPDANMSVSLGRYQSSRTLVDESLPAREPSTATMPTSELEFPIAPYLPLPEDIVPTSPAHSLPIEIITERESLRKILENNPEVREILEDWHERQ